MIAAYSPVPLLRSTVVYPLHCDPAAWARLRACPYEPDHLYLQSLKRTDHVSCTLSSLLNTPWKSSLSCPSTVLYCTLPLSPPPPCTFVPRKLFWDCLASLLSQILPIPCAAWQHILLCASSCFDASSPLHARLSQLYIPSYGNSGGLLEIQSIPV